MAFLKDLKVHVHTPDGMSCPAEAPSYLKTGQFLRELAEAFGLSATAHWSVHDGDIGRTLDNEKTLEENGVREGHHLHLGEDLKVYVHTPDGMCSPAEAPPYLKTDQFLRQLVEGLGLPAGADWSLHDQDIDRTLDFSKTLQENGVREGHHLHLREQVREQGRPPEPIQRKEEKAGPRPIPPKQEQEEKRREKEVLKRCESGHFYDPTKHTTCPYCGLPDIETELAAPQSAKAGPPVREEGMGRTRPADQPPTHVLAPQTDEREGACPPASAAEPMPTRSLSIADRVERLLGRLRGGRPSTPHEAQHEGPTRAPAPILAGRDAVDPVHFAVSAPTAVCPGASFVTTIWAHLERQRKELEQRLREGDVVQTVGPTPVARGTILSIRLEMGELSVQDCECTILWVGEIASATFSVAAPRTARKGPRLGVARVYASGLKIASIHFTIQVESKTSRPGRIPTREKRPSTAFASYASEDRDAVLARIQGILKAAPELDVFLDVLKLRSGEDWGKRLWEEIPSRDIFYLFWSEWARRSHWVEKEWKCALQRRGLDFIDPVPLVSPEEVPPPPELASKHFNDWVLAFMRRPRL